MRVKFKPCLSKTLWGNLGEFSQKGALMGAFVSQKNALIREFKEFISKFEHAKLENKRVKNFALGILPPPPTTQYYFSFSR